MPLPNNGKSLPYDRTDRQSIYHYAIDLRGSTLHEKTDADEISEIAVEGPSLGTMESENQHLYGARMDSVPCAWSRPGASAMARVVSRKHSRREIPRMTRSRSLTPKRAKQREARIIAALWPKGAGKMVESTGSGYLPPNQASVASMSAEVRYAAGIDSGMIPMQG